MSRNRAFAVIAAALLARLVLIGVLSPRRPGALVLFDSGAYIRSAESILTLGKFSISPARPSEPEIVRTPGYPALIAAVFALAGERLWLLAAINALLVAATALLVYHLARCLAGEAAGGFAAVLFSLEPSTFHHGTIVMTEAPFTFCFALALVFLFTALRRRSVPTALAAGLSLGAGTLVRPVLSYGIVPLLVALGALLLRSRAGMRRTLAVVAACGLGALAVVGPWMLRNRRLTGDASVSQIRNVNLYFFDAAAVVASRESGSVRSVEERFGLHEFARRFGFVASEAEASGAGPPVESFPGSSRAPLIELAHFYRDRGLSIVSRHPGRELLVRAEGLAMLLSVPNTISWAHQYGLFDASGEFTRLWVYPRPLAAMARLSRTDLWLVAVSVVLLVPVAAIYAFAVRGVGRLRFPADDFAILLLVALAYLLVASTVPGYADDRLRIPLFPMLCVLAGMGLARRSRG
jgi:4-amino-4-deoxy-L-arabinose transferase-like glycosyltransferase